MPKFRSEGLSLTVEDVERSVAFYVGKLGLELAYLAAPAFAMVRNGDGGLIGLLSLTEARQEGVVAASPEQHRGVHVEFTTDDLDGLHTELVAAGVEFAAPPYDEPWERAMTVYDPDGCCVEFAQGRRGASIGSAQPAERAHR
jgi:catechol 2,3-dioxygenase-like lactoylglutathione lyase family enzyme